jgi:lysophospholipase L1-like esterase
METILKHLQQGQKTRIVAFGSSNTERHIHSVHWLDWLELGIRNTYGRIHTCINTGLCGDTTRGLLQRFDDDVALYQPHVVFVTIGGNDSSPTSGISNAEFQNNLRQLAAQIRALEAYVIFQTYYSADIVGLGPEHGGRFLQFMDSIRRVAADTQSILVDHHRRWEYLRKQKFEDYQQLMRDPLHVTALGNMLLGLDLVRAFGANLDETQRAACVEGIRYQQLLDRLAIEE